MLSYTTVIVTYNRKKAIRQALIRQLKQTVKAKKIIIVDNHSTDETYEYIRDIIEKHQRLEYIRLDENLGGSGGFYYGMKEALKENTDLIAISDDDASYSEDYFEKIIKAAEQVPQDMAFCGAMYKNEILDPTTAKFITSENTFKFKAATFQDYYQHNEFYTDNWSFVGPVFRSKLIKKIGLPNKDFFIWFDDSEYSIRMHKLGYKYHVVTGAKIFLYTDLKEKDTPLWKSYYGFRNEIYTIRKYGRNKVISFFYPYYMLLKKYCAILIKNNDYKGKRIEAYKYITLAFKHGIHGILGKIIDPQGEKNES